MAESMGVSPHAIRGLAGRRPGLLQTIRRSRASFETVVLEDLV
jgi:hypothetical protein